MDLKDESSNTLVLKLIVFPYISSKWTKHAKKKSSNTIAILKSLHINWDIKNQHLIFSSKFTLGPAEMDLRDKGITTLVLKLLASPTISNECISTLILSRPVLLLL